MLVWQNTVSTTLHIKWNLSLAQSKRPWNSTGFKLVYHCTSKQTEEVKTVLLTTVAFLVCYILWTVLKRCRGLTKAAWTCRWLGLTQVITHVVTKYPCSCHSACIMHRSQLAVYLSRHKENFKWLLSKWRCERQSLHEPIHFLYFFL